MNNYRDLNYFVLFISLTLTVLIYSAFELRDLYYFHINDLDHEESPIWSYSFKSLRLITSVYIPVYFFIYVFNKLDSSKFNFWFLLFFLVISTVIEMMTLIPPLGSDDDWAFALTLFIKSAYCMLSTFITIIISVHNRISKN